MSRDTTTAFDDEMNATNLRPALFVKAEFDSGDLFLWSGHGDKDYDGDTYLGAGQLLNITPIKESQKLQANGATFVLSGMPSELVSIALTEEYQSRAITIFLAVLDESFEIIADPHFLFSGKMDIMEISDNGQQSTISVKAESDLIDFKDSKERRYTHEDQLAEYPGDMGLEFMPTNADSEITWGSGGSS